MIGTVHIVMAMKPMSGNFVANAKKHGVAGLNVDGCRIGYLNEADKTPLVGVGAFQRERGIGAEMPAHKDGWGEWKVNHAGRWPANVIHDGSDKVVAGFPEANSTRANGNPNNPRHGSKNRRVTSYDWNPERESSDHRDSGSAARFFKQVQEK